MPALILESKYFQHSPHEPLWSAFALACSESSMVGLAQNHPGAPAPVDLEIRITTPWGPGGHALEFTLTSPSGVVGFHHEKIAGPKLTDPDGFRRRLIEQLEALRKGRDVDDQPVLRHELPGELQTLGADLFAELFPGQLQRIYREISGSVSTVLITSDESWVPWEIAGPFEQPEDDFLCMRFAVTRWLAGTVPVSVVPTPVRRVAFIPAPKAGTDGQFDRERTLLRALVERAGIDGNFPEQATSAEALEMIDAQALDLIHFACHGAHDELRPGESKVQMADRALRPRHISPSTSGRLRAQRPFVFMNACEVGRLGPSLTGNDGWSHRWVTRHGCRAFIGPIWPVRGSRAARFAELVYDALETGEILGAAIREARTVLRQEDPADLAWLAYTVYGHPGAQVPFGDVTLRDPVPARPVPAPRVPVASIKVRETTPTEPGAAQASPRSLLGASKQVDRARSGWSVPFSLPIAASVLIAIVILLAAGRGAWWPENDTTGHDPVTIVQREPPTPDDGSTDEVHAGPAGDTAQPSEPDATDGKSVRSPPPPPRVSAPWPLEPMRQGVIALAPIETTATADPDPSRAIESVLSTTPGYSAFLVDPGREAQQRLSRRQLGVSPPSGNAPWGAEYILTYRTTAERRSGLPPQFASVALTVHADLVETATANVVATASATHTGTGATIDAALQQASERCLRKVTDFLTGGDS